MIERIAVVFVVLSLVAGCAGGRVAKKEPVEPVERDKQAGRVLGTERIYIAEGLGTRYSKIIIQDFSLEGTSIQKMDETEHPDFKKAVKSLTALVPDIIADNLRRWGIFKKVERTSTIESPSRSAVILTARFTTIAAGNNASMLGVLFGGGSSTVGVEGELLDAATGKPLARFSHNRHAPESMGDYRRVLNADGKDLGEDVARFIKKLY